MLQWQEAVLSRVAQVTLETRGTCCQSLSTGSSPEALQLKPDTIQGEEGGVPWPGQIKGDQCSHHLQATGN